ncbi:TIM-barrel domain-containing protein [Porphyrobacter sp. AAP60]|uniref:TIM-barrel domain-containing protein n=1 Tax=Porphyrobacter sp. AAP60 TaxID=1523423 RepID=UPI0006B8F664|nr:TIM-barrel domain-containing protein [Porphyrobacter sp. AAP60]KPF65590.1 hypothetical protein IP79_00085 [Porphyrobacter sp. AAP60]
MLRLVALTLAATLSAAALAGEVRQVPHGMVVTTDTGDQVRVLAHADGTFRVTVATDLPDGRSTAMVVAEADGKPDFRREGDVAYLVTPKGSAAVGLTDGRVTMFDSAGVVLLDEHTPARTIAPVTIEGQQWLATRVQFNRGTTEGLFGLGQHQNRQMNYNGEDLELAQHNMAITVPYLVSTRGYGILWDNASITRVGDPAPYEKLTLDWRAQYYLGEQQVLDRLERTIDYQYLRDQTRWPEEARAAVVAATTGQNTQGNAVQTQRVVWSGTFASEQAGTHKFRLYSSSYAKVFVDGELVLDRWRQNWNPWYHNFEIDFEPGQTVNFRVEWEPNQGYIALEHAEPLPAEDRHSVSFASEAGTAIDYYVVPAPDMDQAIAGYRRLTGKAPMMPRWAYGFWQSRQRYNTQAELVEVMQTYRDQRIPIDNIVQDWFYWPEDSWGCHCFDPARFPDPKGMVDAVKALDGRVMISVWPKFYPDTAHGKALREKGFLYERPLTAGQRDWVGKGYFNTFYDPNLPEARALYWQQMKDTLLPLGFDAWWMDATEPDWHSNLSVEERKYQMTSPTTGTTGAAIFNSYPLVHAEGVFEGLRQAQPDTRPFILTRSGFGGIQRTSSALWSGDVAARWDDLRDQISAGLNLSLAGVPNWTHDIGGFALEDRFSKQDPAHLPEWRELYLRWFQFGAFTPLFRSHGEFPQRETYLVSEGDPAMREGLLHYHRLRYRLMPYLYTVAAGTHFDDGTIMRPLVMDFEADRKVWVIDDQYLFGPSLMAAPVTQFESRTRKVYLPHGSDWFDALTGVKLTGGQEVVADAPRERMPLYVRAGAIIPAGPDVQWTGENPQGSLTLHVFAGADGGFTLYEDEGTDMGYTRGAFVRVPLSWNDASRTLSIGAREGSFPGMAQSRSLTIVLHEGHSRGEVFDLRDGRSLTYSGEAVTLKF